MGWASGSSIAESVWDAVKKHIPKSDQKAVAERIVDIFENEDCDTMHETTLWEIVYKRCPKCDGHGNINNYMCDKCEETGWLKR